MASLLLRLFQSSHFDLRLAVSYLKTYPDSIGITHYLIARLEEFPEDEIQQFWPQFCHLLLTSPTESTALEDFILRRSRASPHLAMLSLWFLQAALSDLAATPSSPAFDVCRRVFNSVQAIIFADLVTPAPTSASSAMAFLGLKPKNKLKPHAQAAAVGLGMVASAIAAPALAESLGQVPLAQGRRVLDAEFDTLPLSNQSQSAQAGPSNSRQSNSDDEELNPSSTTTTASEGAMRNAQNMPPKKSRPPVSRAGSAAQNSPPLSRSAATRQQLTSSTLVPRSRSSADLPPTRPLPTPLTFADTPSPSRTIGPGPTNSSAATVSHFATKKPASASASSSSLALTQSQSVSVPSLPLKNGASQPGSHIDVHRALAIMPRDTLAQLLRAHSCRAQLDLLSSLQDISTRLVSVPKPARVSALRAELTILNHGLPRGCCLGMGCSHHRAEEAHHRVVRISPSESVVLNSADRAPYLIHVEVLEGDLDFDPTRRQNIQDVQQVLSEREEASAKASSRDLHFSKPTKSGSSDQARPIANSVAAQTGRAFAQATKGLGLMRRRTSIDSADVGDSNTPSSPPDESARVQGNELQRQQQQAERYNQVSTSPELSEPPVAASTAPPPDEPMEEMDMVEQLYGDEPLVPEPAPFMGPVLRNRSLDEEAWSRKGPGSPLPPASPASPSKARASNRQSQQPTTPQSSNIPRRPITLDEYADRMRMAAVMLSQLSAQEADAALLSTASAGKVVGLAGAGFEAVKGRLPFSGTRMPSSAGQGAQGLPTKMNLDGAASGLSSVQGSAPLSPPQAGTNGSGGPGNGAAPATSATAAPAHKSKVLQPTEAAAIRERIMNEMQALEEERMSRMRLDSKARAAGWTTGHTAAASTSVEDPSLVLSLANKDDPSGVVLSESWPEKKARIRAGSPYGHLERWNVFSVIVKTGTDLRQEQLATQLIREFDRIWTDAGCSHWVRYFRILVTSESTGLIETITDTMSVHSIKKNAYSRAGITPETDEQLSSYTLYDHFKEKFGEPSTSGFRKAQSCFLKSLASYCVVCYLLQIKDRHNGNILIDRYGHIMHIDFGFLLSNSPGQLGFEMAPFKLPQEYIDILGGLDSERFQDFRVLMKKCFWTARRQAESIIMIVELMQKESTLPCFTSGDQTAQLLRQRFQLSLTQPQCDEFVDRLIDSSAGSVFTRLYDGFQTFSQGIL